MNTFPPLPKNGNHAGIGILIVDDEQDFARGLARLVSGRFAEARVEAALSGKEALGILSGRKMHLMITDLRMPEMSGMQLLGEALTLQPDLSMVVLSAHGTIETAVEALRAGAYDFLTKPIEPELLFRVVAKGLERSQLLAENNRLRQILSQQESQGEMVGEGPAMLRLRQAINAVAQSDYTVLIRGESGTGKELAARLIHRIGTRATHPFLAVNCPSIPENLLESELFGYVKGAFTGADRDRKGLFAAAHTGTFHLDEIGDISPAVQTKLLGFIGMTALSSAHVLGAEGSETLHLLRDVMAWVFGIGLVGLGAYIDIREIRAAGGTPLRIGLIAGTVKYILALIIILTFIPKEGAF